MIALIVSFAATTIMAPVVRTILLRLDILDVPNHRSSHTAPVPRAGGIACLVGVLAGASVSTFVQDRTPWPAIVAASVLAIVGYIDDRAALHPVPRLAAQILLGGATGGSIGGTWGILLGAITIPIAVNVVNFMDGINGITGLNVALWGLVVFITGSLRGGTSLMLIGGVLVGSATAFLPWNVPKSRMFLGDTGSYLFGALIGSGIMLGAFGGVPIGILLAPLSIYFADTGVTIIWRMFRGQPILEAHRDHVYQRATTAGMPHLGVSITTALMAVVVTISWAVASDWVAWIVTILVLVLYFMLPTAIKQVRRRIDGKTPNRGELGG